MTCAAVGSLHGYIHPAIKGDMNLIFFGGTECDSGLNSQVGFNVTLTFLSDSRHSSAPLTKTEAGKLQTWKTAVMEVASGGMAKH